MDNNTNILTKLILVGTCYGIVRNEIYHKYTKYKYYDFDDHKYKYENHTIIRRISYGLINIMLCQPLTLPFMILNDLNILERKYKKLHIDENYDLFPYHNYYFDK